MNKRARYWRQRARIEKVDRKRLQEDIRVLRRSAVGQHWQSKKLLDQVNTLSEREAAALNKVEEMRRDNVKLATELARVQGIWDDTQARLVALQESDMLDLLEKKRLLDWQRGVRRAWNRCAYCSRTLSQEEWEILRRAIEGESVEPKEEI